MNLYSSAIRTLALPLVSVFTESKFWDLFRGFQHHPDSLFTPHSTDTVARLQELGKHAYNSVPFYREKFEHARMHPKELNSLKDGANREEG